jgi:fatty acid amide hydrolase
VPIVRLLVHSSAFSHRQKLYIRGYLWSLDTNVAVALKTQARLRAEVMRRFRAAGVEVCLHAGIFPAIRKNTAKDCDLLCCYCFIWNLLNFPVGAVPVTSVREDEQHYDSAWDDPITRCLVSNMQGSAGLPVGVQVVGLPWHEEAVVEVMKRVEPQRT